MKIYVSLGALAPENMPAEFIARPAKLEEVAKVVSDATRNELENPDS